MHYEIVSALGKGGMGEVWKAKDTRLGREVAIKTLPEEFAKDTDRLARFEREAKLLASLNHPNIAAIHGFEEYDGTHFLVMELVEGDTLADRVGRGAIPVEETLKLALQIAEALEAAHAKGVIHRDLKPANIKVTPDGKVKVLDFGLAKAFAGDEAEVNPANSPTLSMQATQQGMILGTAAYMSPEQARGEGTDQRADVWAFGVVLFEMLSGRGTFEGRTVSDILAAVLAKDPDWSSLPVNLHLQLRRLLERCISKELKDRYHGIADARVDIETVLADPDGVFAQPVASVVDGAKRSGGQWLAVVATALVVGGLAGIAAWTLKPSEPGTLMRFGIAIPEDQAPESIVPVLSVSRDGMRVAYAGGGNQQVYLRNVNEDAARPIQGAGGGLLSSPTFNPEGNWLAYAPGNPSRIVKIPVTGGTPQPVIEGLDADVFGLSWDDRDMILYTQLDGIWQVSANGGTAELIVPAANAETLASPTLLPDGDSILFTSTTATGLTRWDSGQISVYSIGTGERKSVWAGGSDARYIPSGHLVYAQGTTLMALPFDLDQLEVIGNSPARLVEGVVRQQAFGDTANYAVSDTGMLVYITGGGGLFANLLSTSSGLLTTVGLDGTVETLSDEVRSYVIPRVSPDGTRIAVEVGGADGGSSHVYIVNVATGIAEQLTFEGTLNQMPVWTADSQSVVFGSNRIDGQPNAVFIQQADGEGAASLVYEHDREIMPNDLSRDGILAFVETAGQAGQSDLWTLDISETDSAEAFVATGVDEAAARFSSDGRWIAYVSNVSGEPRVYVRPYPATGAGPQQVFDGFMVAPVWSADDQELYSIHVETTGQLSVELLSTAVRAGTDFSVGGRPQPVPNVEIGFPVNNGAPAAPYDVLPDGSGFLWVASGTPTDTEQTTSQINVVLNWFEELTERVPTP